MNPSEMFHHSKRGTRGRRATRWLDDEAVARARIKSKDIKHQMKFMSPMKRFATALALAS
jgi:hypothetical protein